MSGDQITVRGLVATTPRHLVTSEGLLITTFRIASTRPAVDGAESSTNWYTVICYRTLAVNAVDSITKGNRVIVTGDVQIRDWQAGDRSGTNVEIVADAIGHDLSWGTSVFTRRVVTG